MDHRPCLRGAAACAAHWPGSRLPFLPGLLPAFARERAAGSQQPPHPAWQRNIPLPRASRCLSSCCCRGAAGRASCCGCSAALPSSISTTVTPSFTFARPSPRPRPSALARACTPIACTPIALTPIAFTSTPATRSLAAAFPVSSAAATEPCRAGTA